MERRGEDATGSLDRPVSNFVDEPTLLATDGADAADPVVLEAATAVAASGADHGITSDEGQLAGSVLGDRYEIIDLVGRGGMGEVYRARDRELDEILALKVLRPELAMRADIVERFRNEVKLARRVTHRGVARTFELGSAGGVRFLTMELVEGESLAHFLTRRGRLEPAWCARVGAEVCEALHAAHAAGVVHRDIKPDNILLTQDRRTVVTDFGVARLTSDGTRDLAGTPAYMAPEQVRDRPPSAQSDLYALGVTLFEALTGGLPFHAMSPIAMLAARLDRPPPDPRSIVPEIPKEVAAVVLRAMAESPEERFPSALAMRDALLAITVVPSLLPPALAIQLRPTVRKAWTTIDVRAATRVAYASRHLTGALIDEMTLLLGRIPRVRLAVADDGNSDLIVSCVVDDSGGQVGCAATWVDGGEVVWSGRAPLSPARIIAAAETFARSVALAIDVPDPAPAAVDWPSPDVLDMSLRARLLYHSPVGQELVDACQLFADAVRMEAALARGEPRDHAAPGTLPSAAQVDAVSAAPLLAGFAMGLIRATFFTSDETAPIDLAARAVQRALERSPERPEPHLAAGHVALHRGDPVLAARSFREAIRQAPAWPEAHEWMGRMLLEAGAVEDGRRRAETAMRLDGRLASIRWEIARAHALEGRWDDCDADLARMVDVSGALRGRWLGRLRWSTWRRGRAGTIATFEALKNVSKDEVFEPELCRVYAESLIDRDFGPHRLVVRARTVEAHVGSARRRSIMCQMTSEAAFGAGAVDDGLELLGHAVNAGLFDGHWIRRCPLLDDVRSDARFAALAAIVLRRSDAVGDALYRE